MERIILHCDLNNFFASVECIKEPSLFEKPMAVCGNTEERRGIVLAKNEIAKAYGVKTGEAVWEAKKKCPHLITVSPDMKAYSLYSKKVRDIYENYTDLVEPFGIDECWLDISGSAHLFGGGVNTAHMIKDEVKRSTGLTISCGVSFNKTLAKLGSDLKKPDAVTVLSLESWKKRVHPLPASSLMGVGRSTYERLSSRGILTIGDMAKADDNLMKKLCGKNGIMLSRLARGIDDSPVIRYEHLPRRQSIGRGATCPKDLNKLGEVSAVILKLAHEVAGSLRGERVAAGRIQLEVKRNDMSKNEYTAPLFCATQTAYDIWRASFKLFCSRYNIKNYPVRAITVRACELVSETEPRQVLMFEDITNIQKHEKIERAMDVINARYGKHTVDVASCKYTPVRV